ncbi:MAG: hypothetical protein BWY79_02094 [Actinobacteria bacterium ADurb.Bin444]|nr:MAG: hypothetical protein BWY79_02094 [Actinobacteria bacterium ADurb.Bin444]
MLGPAAADLPHRFGAGLRKGVPHGAVQVTLHEPGQHPAPAHINLLRTRRRRHRLGQADRLNVGIVDQYLRGQRWGRPTHHLSVVKE